MSDVKLHGFWPSPYSYRVVWALKLKNIEYEYIEEDLSDKSQLLLQYNPIHKKTPVLVHGGKPISESLIILEYIEQTWPENPLLPQDAYERAMARFWIKFGEDKGPTAFNSFFRSKGKEVEKAKKEVLEVLNIIEEKVLGNKKFFGGNSIGLVDIAFGWLSHWFEGIEDAVGAKLIDPSILPRLHAWAHNFKALPVIKENLPDSENYLLILKT